MSTEDKVSLIDYVTALEELTANMVKEVAYGLSVKESKNAQNESQECENAGDPRKGER